MAQNDENRKMNDRLIDVLERIANSQEEIVRLLSTRTVKEHALELEKYCRNCEDCPTCPLYDKEWNQCKFRSVSCPGELCLERENE